MKQTKKAITSLMAVVLITIVAAMTASAAAAALEGRLTLRPLTPGDITLYKLPAGTESSPIRSCSRRKPLILSAP